jgi:hypothetical protein
LIGFTPKDEQINIPQEVRKVLMYFFVRNHFGVVAAAIQGNVDCEDYISHVHLGLSSMVFEQKTSRFEPPVIANSLFLSSLHCAGSPRTAIHMFLRLSNVLPLTSEE